MSSTWAKGCIFDDCVCYLTLNQAHKVAWLIGQEKILN